MTQQNQRKENFAAAPNETADLRSLNDLYRLSTELLHPGDLHATLAKILDAALEILGATMGNVQLYDPVRQTLEIVAQRGFEPEFLDYFKIVSTADDSACSRAMQARKRAVIEDIELDPAYAPYRPIAARAGYRAVQSTPLLTLRGEFLGVVSTHFPRPHRPSERELRMLDLYLAHATDAIDRIRTEEELRTSRDLYREIGESIPYGVWICDAEGRNIYASESFLQLTGLTQAECSEFGWEHVLHPDQAKATIAAWKECVRSGTTWERVHRVKGVDGEWHPILARGVPVRDRTGKVTAWAGINLDIRNRLHIRGLARRQAEMLEQTHDAIFQWEFDGGIVDWNRGAERLYGFTREEAMGRVPPLMLCTECDGGIEAVKRTLEREGIWSGELQHCTKDGKEIFVESRMLLWRQTEEPPIIIEVNHDITDRKRVEIALRDKAKDLEQQLIVSGRLVSLGQVTASMAHEFNNPLGIIIGFAEELLANAPPSHPEYRALRIIEEESKRCQKIVHDLMEYARPKNVEKGSTDVVSVVERTLMLVDTHLYKQQVRAIKKFSSSLPRIHADYQQLTQVLVNLYLNAIDAMPDGGTLTVGVQPADTENSTLVISVADTGVGITDWEIGKIFEPFYTAKKRRGLGLGLPICERIVKNHGGELKVQSRPGAGTTFEIHLPVSSGSEDEIRHAGATAS